MAEQLSYYIGIPAETLIAMNFEYEGYAYTSMLMSETGKAVGFYDSRYTMIGSGAGERTFDPIYDDAFLSRFWPAAVTVAKTVYRDFLNIKFEDGRDFVTQNFSAALQWDFKISNGYTVTDCAVANMRHNQDMRMMIVAGKYDFCYPIEHARYSYKNIGFPAERTQYLELDSGHDPYFPGKSQDDLAKAMREFIK
ncbi:MAG: hypothetical protein ACK5LL_04945 [Suipraeoptans sp.]